jgi:hypothetical protein
MLIFDWEGSTVGCPFFSMDLLLEIAGRMDGESAAVIRHRKQNGLAYTPCQIAVRRAYTAARQLR